MIIGAAGLTMLAGSFNVNQPGVQIPIITNRWLVGFFFLVHIIFGSFTMGSLVLGPTFEWIGVVRGDPRFERYARALGNVNVKIFSLGATLGGFAVIVVTSLYPRFFVILITTFFWPAVIAFSIWFLTLIGLLTYNLRWDRFATRKGLHIGIGYFTAATEHVFLFIIVALDSFLLTPGTGRGSGAFFNPSYWPELGHRFIGNLSWASFFIAAVAAIYAAASRLPADRLYHHWAARTSLIVGFLTLIPQIVLGAVFVESVKQASPGAFQYSMQGPFAWLWLIQTTFLAILLVGTNLYFWQTRPSPPGLTVTVIVIVASLITMAPAALYPKNLFWLRYVALTLAVLLSLAHWLASRPRLRVVTQDLRRSSQVTLAVTGVSAMLLFLLMGVIRTTARSDYTIYGQLKEGDSYGIFQAPTKGYYP
ncbi:MAG: cytochrome ubiquinol oxidase subunit I [Actinomycetota bacterium]|nr:cytochrome ubiquinol oxidase subunit I [Actinomycetota bacterium]